MADVVAAGDLADRLAVALATFDRALQLAAAFDAATFRALAPFGGARPSPRRCWSRDC